MKNERLIHVNGAARDVGPAPHGIMSDLEGHNVDPAERYPSSPQVVGLGRAAVGIALLQTPAMLELGVSSYSEVAVEEALAQLQTQLTQNQHNQELQQLNSNLHSADPSRQMAAHDTLLDQINPHERPKYAANAERIERLEAMGDSITVNLKYELARLKGENKRIRAASSAGSRFTEIRQLKKRRDDAKAMKGARSMGWSPEKIAGIFGEDGRTRVLNPATESRELVERRLAEDEMIVNILTRKGVVLNLGDTRYVVDDVESTPAQAFVVERYGTDGEPIFKKDRSGNFILVPIYAPDLDGLKVQYHKNGKAMLISEPIPRDNRYKGGLDKNDGRLQRTGRYFYEDGSAVPTGAWGDDSFDPIDDRVVLRRLLSGAEAVDVFIGNKPMVSETTEIQKAVDSGLEFIDARDQVVTLKWLVARAQADPGILEEDALRRQVLETHLVVAASVDSIPTEANDTPRGLRPQKVGGGSGPDEGGGRTHFRRFSYTDPASSRRRHVVEYAQDRATGRISFGNRIPNMGRILPITPK